ncbi:hypothetical protein ZIOFF_056617 [Zingiber officinale]|uniref:Uncharacterized protein n=1 Tax=Zingiber officinale TaxID=94328 RepID=A0A8J5KQH7_ZINOF|nr:hypothetical protein ZIOFF_056617 [Zingiber officinale]
MQRSRKEPMEQALQTKLTIIDQKEESKIESSQENGSGRGDFRGRGQGRGRGRGSARGRGRSKDNNQGRDQRYSDSDWDGDCDDRRSTSCFAFFVGDTTFSWMSKKQPIVTLSTCEAEHCLDVAVSRALEAVGNSE